MSKEIGFAKLTYLPYLLLDSKFFDKYLVTFPFTFNFDYIQ